MQTFSIWHNRLLGENLKLLVMDHVKRLIIHGASCTVLYKMRVSNHRTMVPKEKFPIPFLRNSIDKIFT